MLDNSPVVAIVIVCTRVVYGVQPRVLIAC